MKNLKKGNLVEYLESGYSYSNQINEFGDREIEDWHISGIGKILSILNNSALILFYSIPDQNHKSKTSFKLKNLQIKWVKIDYIYPVDYMNENQITFLI